MAKLSADAKWLGKEIRGFDRIWKDSSLATRVAQRVGVLDLFEIVRPVHYSLAWALGTGRTSVEFDAALDAMPASAFATLALSLAVSHGTQSVRDQWEAWKSAVMAMEAA